MVSSPPRIRISISCLADFVTAPGRSAESLLRPFKFRQTGEGLVRVGYYQPALQAIRAYHKNRNDDSEIASALTDLQGREQSAADNRQRIRLRHNIAAIEAYRKMYGNRQFKILTNRSLTYVVGAVAIAARPDLWVEENGVQVLIKIGMAKHGRKYAEMLLSLLRKAAVSSKHRIRAKNIVYLDVSTGQELVCSGGLTRFNRDFKAAIRRIEQIWPDVKQS